MKTKKNSDKAPKKKKDEGEKEDFAYPPQEDIYNNAVEMQDVDVDDITQLKAPNLPPDEMNEKSFKQDVSGDDLDVPGAELDDESEANGSEDEENNDYSLGGDNYKN